MFMTLSVFSPIAELQQSFCEDFGTGPLDTGSLILWILWGIGVVEAFSGEGTFSRSW